MAEGVKRGMGLPKALPEHVFDGAARLFALLKLFFGSFRHLIACRLVVFTSSDPLKTPPAGTFWQVGAGERLERIYFWWD